MVYVPSHNNRVVAWAAPCVAWDIYLYLVTLLEDIFVRRHMFSSDIKISFPVSVHISTASNNEVLALTGEVKPRLL